MYIYIHNLNSCDLCHIFICTPQHLRVCFSCVYNFNDHHLCLQIKLISIRKVVRRDSFSNRGKKRLIAYWMTPVSLSFHCTGRSKTLYHDLITLGDLPSDTPLALDSTGLLPSLAFLLPDDDVDEADDDALPPDVADDSA